MEALDADRIRWLKRKGFSDTRIATLLRKDWKEVRKLRLDAGIRPVFKRVDTCAAEFATTTAYMYSTYEEECESLPSACTGCRKTSISTRERWWNPWPAACTPSSN